jgi:aerobic-type carbon monoxide dehydrogenase small subunit (CoxS/CutS family)
MSDVELIGDEEVEVVATLNGKPLKRRAKARQHLIDGCTARGCLTLTAQISGKSVETIEGLSDNGRLAELQQEFIARNAAQCGFCSSGMLLTAYELVQGGEKLSRSEIREHISGNMCRCTGYHAIVDAIEAVLEKGSR